jgi:hypothetical protein
MRERVCRVSWGMRTTGERAERRERSSWREVLWTEGCREGSVLHMSLGPGSALVQMENGNEQAREIGARPDFFRYILYSPGLPK